MKRTLKGNFYINYRLSKISKSDKLKILILLLFLIFYLVFYFGVDPSSQSLIAHDEGLYAGRARLLAESDNWFSPPFEEAHHKTLGSYWLFALAIKFFGNGELSLRFPSFICSVINLILVFFIGRYISNKKAAIISVVSLSSMPLWIQYSKYASPDMAYVTCTLLSVYSLISAFKYFKTKRFVYLFLCSFSLSFAFFLRSYMIFIPCISLIPFLFWKLKKENINSYIAVFSGFIVGFVPTILNLYFAYKKHSYIGISSLFEFARNQSIGPSIVRNIYLIPLNLFYLTFPIGLIFFLLFIFTKTNNKISYPFILYGYPLISILILLSMSKSYAHYFLFLLPYLAIYNSILIESFTFKYSYSYKSIKFIIITVFAFLSVIFFASAYIYKYEFIEFSEQQFKYLLYISLFFIISYLYVIKNLIFSSFTNNLISLLLLITVPQFIGINLLYNLGIMGNPNIAIKKFISDKSFVDIYNKNQIYLLKLNSKTKTLLSYYLPTTKTVTSLESIPKYSYLITSDPLISVQLNNSNSFKLISRFGYNYLFSDNVIKNH